MEIGWEGVQPPSRLAEAAASIVRHASELKTINLGAMPPVPDGVFGLDFVSDGRKPYTESIDLGIYILDRAIKARHGINRETLRQIRWCMREIKARAARRDKAGSEWTARQLKKIIDGLEVANDLRD